MDYYRLNQIAMAVLGALLLFFGAKTIVNIAYEEHEPEKPGYEVAGTEPKPGEEKPGGGAGGASDLPALLAAADPARGAEVSKKCAICHSFDKGGPNLIGPNLYGVIGRKIASHEGYEYSDALKAKEGNWDYDNINHMIENPNAFAPGTKMALFPGLPDAKQRADVIVFLRSKNDNPPPLPEVPAGGGEAAGGQPEKPGAQPEKPGGEAATGGSEVVALLATADPKQGEADAALCKVCHTFDKGGATLVGPNLYGVVGAKIAAHAGFTYTPALKAHQGNWTYETLDPWLKNPQAFAPGTMMAFPGVPDVKKRANIIAFLRTKNDNPPPLPEGAAGGAAPAPEKAAETPPAAEPAAPAPAAETPAPAAEPASPAPSAETPAPSAETPAPAAETPAPSAETPPPAAEPAAPPPAAETPPPAAEPAAPAPPVETPAPSAETPAAPAPEEPAPSAETPPPTASGEPAASPETAAPPAETPAPSAETPPAASEAPSAEMPAPSAETPAPAETPPPAEEPAAADDTGPSVGEGPSPSQPQPVYPDGPPDGQ